MTFQKVDQCAPPGPPSGFQCKGNCVNLNNKQKEQQTAETTMLFAIIFQNANLIKAQALNNIEKKEKNMPEKGIKSFQTQYK